VNTSDRQRKHTLEGLFALLHRKSARLPGSHEFLVESSTAKLRGLRKWRGTASDADNGKNRHETAGTAQDLPISNAFRLRNMANPGCRYPRLSRVSAIRANTRATTSAPCTHALPPRRPAPPSAGSGLLFRVLPIAGRERADQPVDTALADLVRE